jgi:hypothetical protein
MWSYPNGEREINHVSWNSSEEYGDCYFDRKTGMLVDLYRVHSFVNPSTNEVIKKADIVKMTSSSLWAFPEFPTFSFPSLLIIGITLGQYSIRKRKINKVKFSVFCYRFFDGHHSGLVCSSNPLFFLFRNFSCQETLTAKKACLSRNLD